MKFVDISVVAANYNNGSYIKQFLDSIRKSSVYPQEIIIIDDCSTDNSTSIIKTLAMENLKLICLEKNVGFANALNIGLENATSKYIMRIDPDDLMDPERITLQYNFMETNPMIDVLGSNCFYYNDKLKKNVGKSNVKISHSEIMKHYLNGENGMIHGTIIAKRIVFNDIKYRQENYPAEEYDIFSRMLIGGFLFHNLDAPLLIYRIHGDSISYKTPLSTVKKIYELNTQYFNRKNSSIKIFRMYMFIRNYRNFLETDKLFNKYFYLLICILFKPESLLKRIKNPLRRS